MLQISTTPAVQAAVVAQVAKKRYESPSFSSVKIGSVGNLGQLSFGGNTPIP